jgi:hypothetical protein
VVGVEGGTAVDDEEGDGLLGGVFRFERLGGAVVVRNEQRERGGQDTRGSRGCGGGGDEPVEESVEFCFGLLYVDAVG